LKFPVVSGHGVAATVTEQAAAQASAAAAIPARAEFDRPIRVFRS
jgi:hypothetical protein